LAQLLLDKKYRQICRHHTNPQPLRKLPI
jgi:hypothetical protein